MWLLVIVPIVAALYGVYLRYVLVKYPEMEEPARRKFIYVVGAVALVLITLDFIFAR
jgi:cytochrome c oxidase assembly factor CtaG